MMLPPPQVTTTGDSQLLYLIEYPKSAMMIRTHLCCTLYSLMAALVLVELEGTTAWTASSCLRINTKKCTRFQLFSSTKGDAANDCVTGVTLKMAFDQQWAVADASETKSERFTSPGSLDLVHRLRARSDCVLVGRGTVQRDDCTLTVRRVPLLYNKEQPVRVVIDTKLSLLMDEAIEYKMFSDGLPLIVYYEEDTRMAGLSDDLVGLPRGPSGALSTSSIIQDLWSRDLQHVMVEGGPATALAFLRDQTIDRAVLIFAPLTFNEPYASKMDETILQQSGLEKLGQFECDGDRVECWSRPGLAWPTDKLEDWP
jgi:riboflavin biosynthesis pyrimidine reductase